MAKTLDMFPATALSALSPVVRDVLTRMCAFMDERVVFNEIGSTIHTKGHCARVMLYSLLLGEKIFGNYRHKLETLAAAAAFHDSRRLDDLMDVGHGARAAQYYKEYCMQHDSDITYSDAAYIAIKYHDLDDRLGEQAAAKTSDKEFVLEVYKIFKDADALDRLRLGLGGLDPTYLRHDEAVDLIGYAHDLIVATIDNDELSQQQEAVELVKREHHFNNMLLIVDPQYDFIDGTLPVPGAGAAMQSLATYISRYGLRYKCVAITVDWHPARHTSFADRGGIWPAHCIAYSKGAAIYEPVLKAAAEVFDEVHVLTKGTDCRCDEYSVFKNAKSAAELQSLIDNLGIGHIDICGLAGDVCVLNTYRDAVGRYGRKAVSVLTDYSPSIDDGSTLAGAVADETNDATNPNI